VTDGVAFNLEPRVFTAEITEIAEPDARSPSFIQARKKSVPTPKNCCSWIYSEYLVFLCGLCGLCGKTETFGVKAQGVLRGSL
jgi:hypothetical protein